MYVLYRKSVNGFINIPTLKFTMQRFTKNLLCLALFVGLFYIFTSRRNRTISDCLGFEEMVLKKVNMDDMCLIKHIRESKLFLPSRLPYNISTRIDNFTSSLTEVTAIQSILKNKNDPWIEALIAVETFVPKRDQRKFLECGALDGVTYSTTLHIERFLNWTGVLIEADSRFYSDMKNVNRKAFGIHACASREPHPTVEAFDASPVFIPINKNGKNLTIINPGIGQIPNDRRLDTINFHADHYQVDCVPVYSALLAVNMTTIDLFVLDVEGVEIDILETIPFEEVDIAVFMIEVYGKPDHGIRRIREFLKTKGYIFYDNFRGGMHPGDDIFIKNKYLKGSDDFKKLQKYKINDIYKIITGKNDQNINTTDIETFVMKSLLTWGK